MSKLKNYEGPQLAFIDLFPASLHHKIVHNILGNFTYRGLGIFTYRLIKIIIVYIKINFNDA